MTVARSPVKHVLRRCGSDQRGATAIEYGLVASLIVVAMLVGLHGFGSSAAAMWNYVSGKVQNPTGQP
jgi:pilus assembly protein Flp/PilA